MVFLGETVKLKAAFYDFNGNVVHPSSHTITVTAPDGSEIFSSTSPIQDGDTYYVTFTVPANGTVGNYKAVWKASSGSLNWVDKLEFAVEEA